jgi:hypothetical protein
MSEAAGRKEGSVASAKTKGDSNGAVPATEGSSSRSSLLNGRSRSPRRFNGTEGSRSRRSTWRQRSAAAPEARLSDNSPGRQDNMA